jgi:hypothetical protein
VVNKCNTCINKNFAVFASRVPDVEPCHSLCSPKEIVLGKKIEMSTKFWCRNLQDVGHMKDTT